MKVSNDERPFRSLFRVIGKTIFASEFIFRNWSSDCVQASIEQWIRDSSCKLEVKGSNPAADKPFFSYFYLIFFWQLLLKKYFLIYFSQFCMHFSTHFDTGSWSNHIFEFIKFRSAFASLWNVEKLMNLST